MKCKETEKLLVITLSRNKRVGFDKKQVSLLNKIWLYSKYVLIFNNFDQKKWLELLEIMLTL